jgi:hypothetical protein
MQNDLRDEFIDPASTCWTRLRADELTPRLAWTDFMDPEHWPPSPAMLKYIAERPRPTALGIDPASVYDGFETRLVRDGYVWRVFEFAHSEIPAGETFVTVHWSEAGQTLRTGTLGKLDGVKFNFDQALIEAAHTSRREEREARQRKQAAQNKAAHTAWLDSIRRKQRGGK